MSSNFNRLSEAALPRSRRVVIFDMDGTLTRPVIDFDRIREEIGLERGPILEAVLKMPPPDRARAESILSHHENAAAANSELQPYAEEVVERIRAAGHPAVLMTRNSRASVEMLLQRHTMRFDEVRTREDGAIKPSPEPVLEICRRFETDARNAVVVGDFHYDLICGNAAGSATVLFLEPGMAQPEWAAEATHIIRDLRELYGILSL